MTEISVSHSETDLPMTMPYQPSWFNRLTHRVDQLPIPYWLFYVALAALQVLIAIVIQWRSGATNLLSPLLLLASIANPYVLGTMHYLNHLADRLLQKFRPVLLASDAEYADLRYRLLTLPARTTQAVMAAGILQGIFTLVTIPITALLQMFQIVDAPLPVHFVRALNLLNLPIAVLNLYYLFHQLRVVNEIYTRHTNIDLFNLQPLYALSNLTGRSALLISLFTYSLLFAVSSLFDLASGWILLPLAFVLVTALVFVLPLLGVHGLLVEEKEKLLLENSLLLKESTVELHDRIKAHKFEGMSELNDTLASLELEQKMLGRISTWPWQPQTLRGVIGTLILPMVIWFGQWILQRLLVP